MKVRQAAALRLSPARGLKLLRSHRAAWMNSEGCSCGESLCSRVLALQVTMSWPAKRQLTTSCFMQACAGSSMPCSLAWLKDASALAYGVPAALPAPADDLVCQALS